MLRAAQAFVILDGNKIVAIVFDEKLANDILLSDSVKDCIAGVDSVLQATENSVKKGLGDE